MKDDLALQRLWMALDQRSWRTAAIVSTTLRVSTLDIANTVAELSWACRGQATLAVDLRATSLSLLDHHEKHVAEQVKKGSCVVLALPSLEQSPIAVKLARGCDVVVLLVRIGETLLAPATRVIDDIGRDKILGAILVSKTTKRAVVPLFQRTAVRSTIRGMPMVGAKP